MSLFPQQLMPGPDGTKLLVYEGFFDHPRFTAYADEKVTEGSCLTVVAKTGGGHDWAVYFATHTYRPNGAILDKATRVENTYRYGSKMDKAIAVVMFPKAAREWGSYRE